MTYHPSPMENFNRKNPIIIMVKRKYIIINNEIQNFSKNIIQCGIYALVSTLFSILSCLIVHVDFVYYLPLFILWILMGIALYLAIKKLKYYSVGHPAINNFSKISDMQMNEILTLNNEEVFNCLIDLSTLYGELSMERKYVIKILSVLSTIIVIYSLALIFSVVFLHLL